MDGAFGLEGELEIDGHGERYEGEGEDELHAVADDERAQEEHRCRGVEEDRDEEGFGGVALERGSVGAGEGVVSGLVELVEFAETFEGHEVAADHPVGNEERDGRDEDAGDRVPAEQHAERVVDGFGEDVEIGDVFGADGREVVDAAHDPEDERHEGEHFRDEKADGDSGGHHEEPLHVGGRDADEASGGGAIFLDGVEAVERRVEYFVDDVVAAGYEGDRDEGEDECLDEVVIEERGVDAEGNDDAGKDEQVLDGVIEACDGEVGAEPLSERYFGGLALRHRKGAPWDGEARQHQYSLQGFRCGAR